MQVFFSIFFYNFFIVFDCFCIAALFLLFMTEPEVFSMLANLIDQSHKTLWYFHHSQSEISLFLLTFDSLVKDKLPSLWKSIKNSTNQLYLSL